MADLTFDAATYVVYLNDGNLLVQVDIFEDYGSASECFRHTVALGSYGRWKEVYLEGRDRAGEFIDLYEFHCFKVQTQFQ